MKKINIIVLFILVISLVTSCGIGEKKDENVSRDPINGEKNTGEKPEEEKNLEEKDINGEDIEDPMEEDKSQEIEDQERNESNELNKNKSEEKEEIQKDKTEQSIKKSSNASNLKKIEKKGYATVDDLNIRSLGSMKGKIITSINKGVEVHVFGEKDNWYYVEYAKNKRGWVYSRYIQFEAIKKDPPKTPKNTSDLKKIEKKGYATVDDLNIRSLGSMKGKIITSIDRGVEVHVFGEKDDWYYVEYAKNRRGWVYSRYIQFNPIKKDSKNTSSLSNKSYNWYFIRNNKHKQPGFGSPHKALLDKYNGITIGKANRKDIFLTFDNGYENGYTPKILDILKRQNVKASFFVQGTYIDANPGIVKRMVKEGHIVLNHTNSHPEMPTLSTEKLQHEINTVAKKYKKLTGKEMHKFLRPPSGVFSEKTLAETKKLGYRTVFWSMAYRDWLVDDQPGKAVAYKHVTDNIHNGAVILLHSVSKSNTEALEDIIKELKRQGYNFKLLSQYP